jgi:hypothetical protein
VVRFQRERTKLGRFIFCAVLCQFCAVEFVPTVCDRAWKVCKLLEKHGFALHTLGSLWKE